MNQIVICDTNIWRMIAANEINEEQLIGKSLIATRYTIEELIVSAGDFPKIIRDAFKVLLIYKDGIIWEDFSIYLAKMQNPLCLIQTSKRGITSSGISPQILYSTVKKLSSDEELPVDQKSFLKRHGDDIRQYPRQFAQGINKSAKIVKANIKNTKKHQLSDSIHITKGIIKGFVQYDTKNEVSIYETFNWAEVEFFLNAFDSYRKRLETGAINMADNDLYDLLNMVYVKPGYKYWTHEKTIFNKIGLKSDLVNQYVITE